jgi:hypothetical protein
VAVTIIALAGIAAVASVSLLVQSASATTDVMDTGEKSGETDRLLISGHGVLN